MIDPVTSRRELLAGAAVLLAMQAQPAFAAVPIDSVAAGEAGFRPDLESRLDQAIAEKRVWNLHGVVVVRDGRLVLERYFEAEDNARGRPLGKVTFKPETLHDMRSVSKGIVALLYGVALEQGKVTAPEAPLFDSFPEYSALAGRDGRDRLTVHHVLSMTMGTDWDETSLPYSDPRNSEIAMDMAADRYRYVLERRVVTQPGLRFTYCGGATALLARMIARGTGKPLHAFAREVLFDPLGLGATEWLTGRDGEPIAASGLRMTPRDLVQVGTMMLRGGMAPDGRRLVSTQWIDRCTSPVVSVDEVRRFGYHWYSADIAFGKPLGWAPGHLERAWMAFGEGGQRLYLMPGLNLAVVVTAGNYGADDQWIPPTRVLREVVLDSVL